MTLSQKDYYVTEGDKTIASKDAKVEQLTGIITMKNRFKQKNKEKIDDSFTKRKLNFKSLLSAPFDMHIFKRRTTLQN